MLRRPVTLYAVPLHGVQLAGLLFAEYLQSSLIQFDILEIASDIPGLWAFFRTEASFQTLIGSYTRAVGEKLLFRFIECGVSAACLHSGVPLLQDAVAYRYLYPIVQEYRFARCWVTRLLRGVARLAYPSLLRRIGGTVANILRPHRDTEVSTEAEAERQFFKNPPQPSATQPFDGMPASCRDALHYWLYSYQARPFYTVVASGLVTDVSVVLMEQLLWAHLLYQERLKPTSWGRVLKPYLSSIPASLLQTSLSIAARSIGVWMGQRLSKDPTGSGIFWGEKLTLVVLAPGIQYVSLYVRMVVRQMLEERHPATVEDDMENNREKEAAEAEQTRSAPFSFSDLRRQDDSGHAAGTAGRGESNAQGGRNGGGDGSSGSPPNFHASGSQQGGRHRGTGGSDGVAGASRGANYYEVLGVGEKATAPEIKRAYRTLALRTHPDRAGHDPASQQRAREHMSLINEAYDVLIDDTKRSHYDASRIFAEATDFFQFLDSMSMTQLLIVSTAGMTGLFGLLCLSLYANYCAVFNRVTSLGQLPLQMFFS